MAHTEHELIVALRKGDEGAFKQLVAMYRESLLRVAMTFVSSRAVAEEVVQETWLGVLKGIDSFEGRSSLKTWIFRILANIARTRGKREARSVPLSDLEGDEPAVDLSRFGPSGAWIEPPHTWPEEALVSKEIRRVIDDTIAAAPPAQRTVITLRDVEGWTAEEVRNALEISETNQRVLLHRARSRVRAALEKYLDEERVG